MPERVGFGGGAAEAVNRVASVVDLRILGPVEVVDESGEPRGLSGPRQRALLALLALNAPGLVTTDRIVEALWGDSGVARPEAALHMAVSRLRGAVGEERVLTLPGGYRLDLPVPNTDVNRFRALVRRGRQMMTLGHPSGACESLRQALAQWRGPALADLRDFEFAEQAARRLEDERVAAVELLMEAMLDAGEHDLVVGELFGLVEEFPYRERFWWLLMLALYRSGRQAEALAAFNDLRSTLGEDLGLEPAAELVDLEERILLHDPALAGFQPSLQPEEAEVEYINFAAGEVIVEQGARASTVYWVEEGRIEILKADAEGTPRRLAELGPGHYFGELAATLGTRRTATVKALVPTTVSAHDLQSFRARLGAERERAQAPAGSAEELWDLIRRGDHLRAFDQAADLIESGEAAPEVRYLAVLALARAGATSQARRRYAQYGLGSIDASTLPGRLAGDIAVLSARLDKDEAVARLGTSDSAGWAARAATGYAGAYESTRSAYHAVNAATMWLLAGKTDEARRLASEALAGGDLQGDGYWDAVTEAEAALIVGDLDRAEASLRAAGTRSSQASQRATTLKQLKLVCEVEGHDPAVLDPIRNPTVIHYCGHRILPAGETGRFPAEEEGRVRADLSRAFDEIDAGVGFGSLAAGADILAAEVLLGRGAELHVVLPFDRDEFVRTSVVSAGGDWVERFDRCLASATSVEVASAGEYLDDPVMFDFCARMAMGDALIRARQLATEAHQVAVWDGTPSYGVAGTAVDVRTWGATGAPSTVIGVTPGEPAPPADHPKDRRHVRAVLFADFAGFSKLSDAQLVLFQERVMKTLSAHLEPYRPELLSGRTWGDGIYLVFGDVAGAAECALDLVSAVGSIDMSKAGLPQLRGLRVAAHAAPVFEGWDPISGTNVFYGSGVTQAARIEPRTPEGEIYTTHAFASLAMLSSQSSFECQYVGTLPTAKQFGEMPLYALRRRVSAGR